MALPAVYFLILFSMLPLLQASRCPTGKYCPTGLDCDEDLNLCQSGMCTYGENRTLCDNSISVEFTRIAFSVDEGGQIDAILRISEPLGCCPFSLQILVEDISATKNVDYEYPRNGYIQVIFHPGNDQTVTFTLKTKEDRISETTETFRLTIVELSLPRGVSVGSMKSAEVEIRDNDPACVEFARTSYSVSENSRLSVTVQLDVKASYNIPVRVTAAPMDATGGCDYDATPYDLQIKPGDTRVAFDVAIIDDDVYEGPESFNLVIDGYSGNSHVQRCSPFRTTITIKDNEQQISLFFEHSSYSVDEDAGSILPVLELSKPAPCCITVYAELTDITANGAGVDYGYPERQVYEYTFSAGETCSTPLFPIPIINDTVSEKDERFMISIIDISVPFNVRVSRKSAQITIKDNDIEVCFEKPRFEINEINGPLKLRLKLDKPAEEETMIRITDFSYSAVPGVDYERGPYYVTVEKNRRESDYFTVNINGTEGYTGDKTFELDIDVTSLYNGLVPCVGARAEVTIVDNEFGVCFDKSMIMVTEGERVEVLLRTTRQLSGSVYIPFIYGGDDNYPYTASSSGSDIDYYQIRGVSIRNELTVRINTRNDATLERDERFSITIDPDKLPVGLPPTCYTKVIVTIENDDDSTLYFERNSYSTVHKNELLKPVIKFSNQIDYEIAGYIRKEDGTAVDDKDYRLLNENPIEIGPGTSKVLFVDPVDDDIVEMLKEHFTLRIVDVGDPNVHIDEARNHTKITINDDDISQVQIIQDRLDFTNGIYRDCPVRIAYTGAPTPFNYTLLAGNSTIELVTDVDMVTVCIPDILYDERPSRYRNNKSPVTTSDKKVDIIPFRKC